MKKLLLLAAAALIGFGSASAKDITVELDSSKIFVGGAVGVWYNQTEKYTQATILPEIGYNINKTWTVGAQLGYEYKGTSDIHNNSLVFNPYARWTYLTAGMVQLFVDGGVDFSLGATGGKAAGDSKASATFGIGFRPGVALNVNKHVSVVAHIGYLGYKGANDAAVLAGAKKGFGFGLQNTLNFGFYYNF